MVFLLLWNSNVSNDAGAALLAGGLGALWLLCIFGSIIFSLAVLAFTIWMLVDCVQRPEEGFSNRTLWIVLLAVSFIIPFGFIIPIIYYFAVKRKIPGK